jgi:hypothetical protein
VSTLTTTSHRIPALIAIAAIIAGAVLGTFEIANTSIGWHLASGRWILDHGTFLRADPFSFTSAGTPWIDHEWLFQVGVAAVQSAGGAAALGVVRMLTVVALALLLLVIAVRSGLSPAAALLLSILCVVGARPRFFLRPELVTLLVVPLIVWLFLTRGDRRSQFWLIPFAALMILGANAHGGVLVVPILLAGIFAAETAQSLIARQINRPMIASGVAGITTAVLALLVNPYGWRLLLAPFRLAHLVDQPYIPNPEWVSPTFAQTPVLYLVIAAGSALLILRERRADRWILFVMAAALALRHVRNVGLFFVLLPLAVAPALATWRALAAAGDDHDAEQPRPNLLAAVAAILLAVSIAAAPWPRFGFGFAKEYYPTRACSFLDAEGLPGARLYNDVRFGGYLIDRYFPPRQVFQDDRNEIHETLLREIWEILETSDVAQWSALLARWGIDAALVRFHPPISVTNPEGDDLGERGFSALWFPDRTWALIYWDEIAMVLVRRGTVPDELLERHEYRVIRPDDLDHLRQILTTDESLRLEAADELARALDQAPAGWRAHEISTMVQ